MKFGFAIVTLGLSLTTALAEGAQSVTVDCSKPLQTIEGWGSSLCWWASEVGKWKDEQKMDELVECLTSPDKLNMNIFRYNIGGGDDPSHIGGHMVKGKGKRAEMEGFKASATAPYNWNADAGQRKVMLKIRAKRPDLILEAFANSPPYWMTFSGCAAGNNPATQDNLKPEFYEPFCDYLLEVCKHYKKTYNVDFRTLEPFNESLTGYWNALGSQEGCHFEPSTQAAIIRLLHAKLVKSGLRTQIAASDETSLSHFLKILNAYEKEGDIFPKIRQLNTHTYHGTAEERERVRQKIALLKKPFWQSETGPSGKESGLKNNLHLTQKLFDDMRLMQPIAWLDWQMMEEWNDTWCLFQGKFSSENFRLVKNYYVRMQITRFFRQQYRLATTDHPQCLAAVSPNGKRLAIALLNSDDTPKEWTIHVPALAAVAVEKISLLAWRTSGNENCDPIPFTLPARLHKFSTTTPAVSLTTIVINIQ
jgi:O-glycosyl hydrolase